MSKNRYKIEICANSVASCIEAQKGGAYRVELCTAIPEGGTTPSFGEIALARELLDIKLNVIIRPRAGDFFYSELEHKAMLKDIEMCSKLGVDGVVFGTLTANGNVDMARNAELIAAANGMSTTFHRAFDMCKDPFQSLDNLIELGFDRLLTSGMQPKAMDGSLLLGKLVERAASKIVIMPGSGVCEENIVQLAKITGATEFHMSLREGIVSKMQFRNPTVSMGGTNINIDEYSQDVTNANRVAKVAQLLQNI